MLKIVDMAWMDDKMTTIPRSKPQTGAVQFKFTVAPGEVPRPGALTFCPVGPAGGNARWFYKIGETPFEDAEGGTQGPQCLLSVSIPSPKNNRLNRAVVMPGKTYYVAVRMTGGNQPEYCAELARQGVY